MGFSKKTAKGRLDKYYFLAKDQGYRARSAFKLVQLNKKYNLLDQARVVIDLCAAPGGWLQVAAKFMPVSHVIIGVDLAPIRPIPGVTTFVGDITTDSCRSELKKNLKNWKADVVLHDGAPNVGTSWVQDAYSQAELVLHSLKLATEFLNKGGVFVTKVFRSKDYNSLIWVFNQLFSSVDVTKPSSSRDVSAEIFVVCQGYLSPDKIDPRFLDPCHVFEDISLLQSSATMDILKPEKHTRHRDGYEDGATILYKTCSILDFINSNEPNKMLATINNLSIPSDIDEKVLKLISGEHRSIFEDLKVLGKREFKVLIKFRKQCRSILSLDTLQKTEEGEEGEDQEVKMEKDPLTELELLAKKKQSQEKREKRKVLERKAKQRIRMQLDMGNADDLAEEFTNNEQLFSLNSAGVNSMIEGDADMLLSSDSESESSNEQIDNGHGLDEEESDLEDEWDEYLEQHHQEKLSKELIKNPEAYMKALHEDDSPKEIISESEADQMELDENPLLSNILSSKEQKAADDNREALWFNNPIFKHLQEANETLDDSKEDFEVTLDEEPESSKKKMKKLKKLEKVEKLKAKQQEANDKKKKSSKKDDKPEPGQILFVKADSFSDEDNEDALLDPSTAKESLLTPSGMTLASKFLENKTKAKKDLVDQSFNRYAHKDEGLLPKWFLDDEQKYNIPQKPVTKAGIELLKSKQKIFDARPIKKVLEAKGRNRMRVMKKLDAMKKKAAVIVDNEEMGEKQKSDQIQKMLAKASKPQKKETKLVVAKGSNRGLKGRPKGVKGHYKMVDRRMKKEIRANDRKKKTTKKSSRKH